MDISDGSCIHQPFGMCDGCANSENPPTSPLDELHPFDGNTKAAELATEPPKPKPRPKTPTKGRKATQKRSANNKKPHREGWGLEQRREWSLAVARNFRNQPAVGRLAAILAMYADNDGCFFVGMDTLAESLGVGRDTIKVQRKALVNGGCIQDTGRRKARATVWRLIHT